ncbi:MAG TPA: hypothetical protein VLC09_15565 [Polyangiaceae bacterium]|nr:hypothetical protein [Polyangiaceae bacterium]
MTSCTGDGVGIVRFDTHLVEFASPGWPEASGTYAASLFRRVADSTNQSVVDGDLVVTLLETRGEVLAESYGLPTDDPELELTSADYLRTFRATMEVDCSDDPVCGGIWLLDVQVSQTAESVQPLVAD